MTNRSVSVCISYFSKIFLTQLIFYQMKNHNIVKFFLLLNNMVAKEVKFCSKSALVIPCSQMLFLTSSFFIWKFPTWSADRSTYPIEKKASGQDRCESHFHVGLALDSCQSFDFLLTNHIPKDI